MGLIYKWVFWENKSIEFLGFIQAFEKHSVEKDVAEYIKKEFDKRHGPTWHCIVGRNFGNPFNFSLPFSGYSFAFFLLGCFVQI